MDMNNVMFEGTQITMIQVQLLTILTLSNEDSFFNTVAKVH